MQGRQRELFRIARGQRSLITRGDLRAIGVSPGQRRTMLGNGLLTPVGRQTFVVGGAAPDPRRSLLAACLDVGGVASHRSAALLHDIPGIPPPPLPEVSVCRDASPHESALSIVHSTTWLPADDVTRVDGIPATSVARTLFGLAGQVPELTFDQVRGAVDDAIRLGRATDPWLWWRLEKLRCRGRTGVAVLEAILTQRAGGKVTESWLEREFLRSIEGTELPEPVCQRRVKARGAFVARVDFAYVDLGIIIEVTGAVGHSTRDQRAADARRRNRLGTLGLLVLEFTYEQVVGSPNEMIEAIWDAIRTRHSLQVGA